MVSTLNLDEKYNRVRRNFCFYLDIQDHGVSRSLSRRIQDMGLQQEVFLTSRVTHVVRSRAAGARWRDWRARADAMLQRGPGLPPHANHVVHLSVQKAISLLDKLYDTFFTASRKAHVTLFTKHFIKIEFLDKLCRPIYKEFDEWPEISIDPDPPKEKKKETPEKINNTNQIIKDSLTQKMTRKSRPRVKERSGRGGYCEMCACSYADAALHRREAQHVRFVRDAGNFLALDALIGGAPGVAALLQRANGERRARRSGPIAPPPIALNGHRAGRNGCSKRAADAPDDRHYYKVVSTKLRSSGGFATKRKDSPPPCNGTKPLVVKFRKVRRSELSVLSDEAEQFMFPKRASSTSSTSSGDDDDEREPSERRKVSSPPPSAERRRQARPLALKEESSEEDSWPEDKRRRKKRAPPAVKRAKRLPCKSPSVETEPEQPPKIIEQLEPAEITVPAPNAEVSPLRDEPTEKCMKWEDGRLKYTPAVEQLEFAFECVPHSEPWFETFKRQDEDKVLTKNVPKYFALYSKSPKLPYEIGQLPPLKPNCCPLSDLVKREEKPGPSRSYGTRGMKKQKIRKRTAALLALEGHPRKSPREHASTLAILGSAGLVNRRKHADDNKSTASEDTISDTHSNIKLETVLSETQEASERLQQFLSEVFEDAGEYDVSDEVMEGEAAVASASLPDVSSLVSECDSCDLLRHELQQAAERPRGRRGKFKKKNRTGWPNKRKRAKGSRTNSEESERKADSSLDRSSTEPHDEDTRDTTISEEDVRSVSERDETVVEAKAKSDDSQDNTHTEDETQDKTHTEDETQDKTLIEDDTQDKTLTEDDTEDEKAEPLKEKSLQELKTALAAEKERRAAARRLGAWLQPVVRLPRVPPAAARKLRSAARARACRLR